MNLQEYKNKLELKKTEKFEKRKLERKSTPEEIIFILEKTLEDWKTIKIYNVLIQQNPQTKIIKKDVEQISTGNTRILQNELDNEKYIKYKELREKVYEKHKNAKELSTKALK